MSIVNALLGIPLGYLIKMCYLLFKNYGIAIILFTLLIKIILLPISVWVHKNGIKVVRLQPELNRIKASYFGDADRIAEETSVLYKREKYNPFASLIPLFIQIILLMGLINVIYHPLDNLLHFDPAVTEALIQQAAALTGMDPATASIQLSVVDAMKNPANGAAFQAVPGMGLELLESVRSLNMGMLGINLAQTPVFAGGMLRMLPLMAGASAFLLCVVQNRLNPLQAEQGKWGKAGTMAVSVGISLFLGAFVPAGVGFYWIWSNLFTILQQLVLNKLIDPKKHIDYAALGESKQALEGLQGIGGQKKRFQRDPYARREKEDYKRFFSIANKHLVFYSEKSGFYKYFESVIEYLLSHSNLVIHYVTSDPEDAVFEKAKLQPQIKPYYIGEKKLITLMMKMDADMVVMTMPDLDNFHIKRSYVRKDIEYIYMFHHPMSVHMILRKGALDHYDTIFCVGEFQIDEIRQTEALYELAPKKLIPCGYGQLEKLDSDFQKLSFQKRNTPKILIAPSWQQDNLLDSCLDKILEILLKKEYLVVVRPHPEYIKRYRARMDAIVERYQSVPQEKLTFELDFSNSASIFDSDIVITDWSGTAYEFSFVTKKPCLFIDTPPKINNPEYNRIAAVPLDISLRAQIGEQLKMSELEGIDERIKHLFSNQEAYKEKITALRERYIANPGKSGEAGGRYILQSIKEKQKRKAVN